MLSLIILSKYGANILKSFFSLAIFHAWKASSDVFYISYINDGGSFLNIDISLSNTLTTPFSKSFKFS
jgi:hypothetical protein